MGAWDRKVDRWTECHSKSLDLLNGILEARGSILACWGIITIIYMPTICLHWVLDKMSKNRMFPACMGFRGRKMLNKQSSIKLNCHQAMEYYMVLCEACMGRFTPYRSSRKDSLRMPEVAGRVELTRWGGTEKAIKTKVTAMQSSCSQRENGEYKDLYKRVVQECKWKGRAKFRDCWRVSVYVVLWN